MQYFVFDKYKLFVRRIDTKMEMTNIIGTEFDSFLMLPEPDCSEYATIISCVSYNDLRKLGVGLLTSSQSGDIGICPIHSSSYISISYDNILAVIDCLNEQVVFYKRFLAPIVFACYSHESICVITEESAYTYNLHGKEQQQIAFDDLLQEYMFDNNQLIFKTDCSLHTMKLS